MSMRARVSLPNRLTVMVVEVVSVMAVAIVLVQPAAAIDTTRQAELTTLVRQDCGSCHGMTLKGGLGKPLLPEALQHLDADSIASIILEGVPGQPMPPWKGLVSAEDVLEEFVNRIKR